MIEVEITRPNTNFHFRPLQRNVRGPFEMGKVPEPMAKIEAGNWPMAVPSQRLGIDADGNGYIAEPLHSEQFAALREKIEKRGQQLEPQRQTFGEVDQATWLFWIKRAVESGLATVVNGTLPEVIEGKPRMNFILAEPGPSPNDKLTAAMERQAEAFEGLTAAILKLVEKGK